MGDITSCSPAAPEAEARPNCSSQPLQPNPSMLPDMLVAEREGYPAGAFRRVLGLGR